MPTAVQRKYPTPRHVAFIMDGNGRWATAQGRPRSAGHKAGYEHIPDVLELCDDAGVQVVSAYAWSTENWNRPKHEAQFILRAVENQLPRFAAKLHERNVRFVHSGFGEQLTPKARRCLEEAVALTAHNDGNIFNLAYNYGGRAEILHAARRLLRERQDGARLTAMQFEACLFTAGLPDVDLVIRTGGEMRLSNFLLWQSAHAVVYIAANYWPAFRQEDLDAALAVYRRAVAPA